MHKPKDEKLGEGLQGFFRLSLYYCDKDIIEFDASKLPSGVYFYQLRSGGPETGSGQGIVQTKKMILLK